VRDSSLDWNVTIWRKGYRSRLPPPRCPAGRRRGTVNPTHHMPRKVWKLLAMKAEDRRWGLDLGRRDTLQLCPFLRRFDTDVTYIQLTALRPLFSKRIGFVAEYNWRHWNTSPDLLNLTSRHPDMKSIDKTRSWKGVEIWRGLWKYYFQLTHYHPTMPVGNSEKRYLRVFSVQYRHNSKNIAPPPGNLKFDYLGIFQSLKLRISLGKILPISLQQNFTPNTLGCHMCWFNWFIQVHSQS